MNPLRVRGENVGRFPSFDIQIPEGRVAITGPNGAGKSTLLNAIEIALFANGGRDLGPLVGPFGEQLSLELEFEHAGETYRVRRGGGKRTTLDLETYSDFDGAWSPLTRETTKETQAFLERLLGLSRRTFRASAFLKQGDSAAFPDADPSERKQILGEALDPHGLWPKLAERAKTDARLVEKALEELAAQVDGLAERAARLPAARELVEQHEHNERAARSLLENAEAALERAQAQLAETAAAAERVKTAQLAVDHAARDHTAAVGVAEKAQLAFAQLAGAREHLAKVKAEADRVAELEEKLDEQRLALAELQALQGRRDQAVAELGHAQTAAANARAEALRLHDETERLETRITELREHGAGERCHVCEQEMGIEARKAAIRNLTEELEEAAAKLGQAQGAVNVAAQAVVDRETDVAAIDVPEIHALEDFATPLDRARRAQEAIPAARHNVDILTDTSSARAALAATAERKAEELTQAEHLLEIASAGITDRAPLENAVVDARRDANAARTRLDGAVADAARSRHDLEQLTASESHLAQIRRQQEAVQRDLDLYRLAEKAFGRDGIPTLIAENVIPTIEAGANDLLAKLPTEDGQALRLELHTQRELKSSSELRETLDIVVTDQDGQRAYETFSGGERARLNIALRIALARLLAGRRGAESRLLAVDELEFLDELGQEKLVDLLRDLDGFDRILVVSHSPAVRDAFDTTIEIAKRDGVSAIMSAVSEFEAVVA